MSDYLITLPHELIMTILAFIDYKSSLRIRYVCKLFSALPIDLLLKLSISKLTRFDINEFTIPELIHLAKVCECRSHISAGYNRSFIISDCNTSWTTLSQVYSFGQGRLGVLGLGNYYNRGAPAVITGLYNIVQVSSSKNHTLMINNEYNVFSCGNNFYGNLGLWHYTRVLIPTLIPVLTGIVQVVVNETASLTLKNNGRVYFFGKNFSLNENINRPVIIPDLYDIIQISMNDEYGLALSSCGHVYMISNTSSITQMSKDSSIIHISGENTILWLTDKKQLGEFDRITFAVTHYWDITNIISIAIGRLHGLMLTIRGEVYAFGNNKYGQLGLGDNDDREDMVLIPNLSNIIAIAVGYEHSLILTDNEEVYAFGRNCFGQLGLGDSILTDAGRSKNTPTLVMSIR